MFSNKKADCPLWRGPCRENECRWYIQVIGNQPNTGEQINKWDCAIAFLPMLTIQNSMFQRQTGASVDKVATEVRNAADQGRVINLTLPAPDLKLINNQ